MSVNEKASQEKLLGVLRTRFNELAQDLKLTEEQLEDFDTQTEAGLTAGIGALKFQKAREKSWNEQAPFQGGKPNKFHPVEKRAAQNQAPTQQPAKPNEEKPVRPTRFNMAQLTDARLQPSFTEELEGSENTIMRVYAFNSHVDGDPERPALRYNAAGFKV